MKTAQPKDSTKNTEGDSDRGNANGQRYDTAIIRRRRSNKMLSRVIEAIQHDLLMR